MDAILSEISHKRKEISTPPSGSSSPHASKYLRKGDLDRAREEDARRKREEEERLKSKEKAARDNEKADRLAAVRARTSAASNSPTGSSTPIPTSKPEAFNISSLDVIRRLRSKGQPILLFGESEKDRRLRLRALELLDEKGGASGAGVNDFKKAMAEMEEDEKRKEVERRNRATMKGVEGEGKGKEVIMEEEDDEVLDLQLVKTNPKKVYPLIYYALKKVLKEWEQAMDARPDSIKQTMQGRMAAATQVQAGQYLKPLMKSLRQRDLQPDVLRLLAEIIHHMQCRQYQKANDAYLRLSIGNAAWPIGVTMVGIHERSAREKIGIDSVAHVLNDEVSRKYIQSVKRLLTFAQTIRPPEDVSQLMG